MRGALCGHSFLTGHLCLSDMTQVVFKDGHQNDICYDRSGLYARDTLNILG